MLFDSPLGPGHAELDDSFVPVDEIDGDAAAQDGSHTDDIVATTDPQHDEAPRPAGPSDRPVETPPRESATTPTGKPMPPLPSLDGIMSQGVRRPGVAPQRIGSGRLVPARLTWKPGDPFAGRTARVAHPFRWELMLTAASITSACGLGCIWLLRTILA
jgi:hypothetical protein